MQFLESEEDHIDHHKELDAKIDMIMLQTEATQCQIQRIEDEFTAHLAESEPIINSIFSTLQILCDELHITKSE